MKKNISRNPLWPDWYNGKKIDEVQFGRAFLEQWPLKCVNGTLYTLDGPVEDESEIKQRILENIEEYVTSGLSKKVTNILETIKLLAFSDPFPIEQACIHLQNGVYHLPDGSFQESRLFCQNRLPVKYDPKAATPDRWLTFLHELLDEADIPTLQEYLGYCLIPSTKGQKMMLIVGKGGEGKSRIGLVLKRLMGDAASNGSVQKVENNRFARADLERRLLMIDDDMDMNALPKTNYIKTIVTAEAKLDLERKGVQSYQRDIYARFLCFGNGALTSLYDHSDGFFRRQLKALVGTVKETVMQVSRSKKWASKPLLDDAGKPVLQKNGKPVLKKSYSILQDDFFNYMHNAGYTDVERGERGSTEEHLTVTQFKVQREQERLDSLTAQADQKAQSLAKTSQTLSKKEKELAAVQKKATLTKEALIHARDLDYIGKRTFLGNYSLTEEEFSKLKKQADRGYMMDVENRRLKEELSTAKKEAIRWSNKYHDLWYDVKPYLDALHRAPELVRGFLEKILAPKQERTMNVPQKNRKRGQDMEL